MRPRQAGTTLFEYLLGLAAIAGMLAAVYWAVDRHWATSAGIDLGRHQMQVEWQAADRRAQAAEQARATSARATVAAAQQALLQAGQTAADYRQKWLQQRKEAQHANIALTNCPTAGPGAAVLTGQFVREYDSAWTDSSGQPVFADPARPAGAALDAAGTVTAADVLDNHQANAERCSEDRRRLSALIETLGRLRKNWETPR